MDVDAGRRGVLTPKRTPGKNARMSHATTAPSKPDRNAILALPTSELILRARVGVENFDARLMKLSDAQLDRTFPASAGIGEWSCRVLLGHLADAELANVHRIRKMLAEEHPVLTPWDENAFIDAGLYGKPGTTARFPIGGFVATLHTLRQWTHDLLTTLDEKAWQRAGLHPEKGELTVRTIVVINTWHLEHHAWFLNRKVEAMAGQQG
jgi:hypothetical protein